MFENVKDYIYVQKGIIPKAVCDQVVSKVEVGEWHPHTWYLYSSDEFTAEVTNDPDTQYVTPDLQALLAPYVIQATSAYNTRFAYPSERTKQIMGRLCAIRFNRYSPGQYLRQHQDHIHSLFDGNEKGIPVLSIVGNLNDDYDGAEFNFWDDYVVPLGTGDILMFPSLFMYPHGVTVATRGKRYSFVSWAW